jgi:hypothetical protein
MVFIFFHISAKPANKIRMRYFMVPNFFGETPSVAKQKTEGGTKN